MTIPSPETIANLLGLALAVFGVLSVAWLLAHRAPIAHWWAELPSDTVLRFWRGMRANRRNHLQVGGSHDGSRLPPH
jgi:hypothetical protein